MEVILALICMLLCYFNSAYADVNIVIFEIVNILLYKYIQCLVSLLRLGIKYDLVFYCVVFNVFDM